MSTLKDMAYAVWCVPKGAFDQAKIIFYSAKFRIYQRAGILKRLSEIRKEMYDIQQREYDTIIRKRNGRCFLFLKSTILRGKMNKKCSLK